jgi:lysozyme family protein
MNMKEFLNKIKQQIITCILWVETEYLGADGSVKREAVIDKVADVIDIPYLPGFVEKPLIRLVIGFFNDNLVGLLNWLTGYDFKGAEISEEAQVQLAEAADAPLPVVQKAIASAGPSSSVEDKIKALYEQYGIKAEEKETPQQETIQAQTPAPTATEATSYQWDKILSFILAREGGYSNHPDDKGGETNMGITKATLAAAYAQGLVKHNDVKKLTRDEASAIYAAMYYKNYGYDKLPLAVSLVVTDTTVNHGRGGAAKIVQRALVSLGYAITVDGKWGPKTQAALETACAIPATAAQMTLVKRKNYYDDIISANPSQAAFKNGWYNRLKALAAEAGVQSPV